MTTRDPMTNTETKEQARSETVEGEVVGGAIAVAEKSAATLAPTLILWTKERIELIRRMKAAACNDDEFAVFLEQCKRTGMDPLLDEADCVPRYVTKQVRQPNGAIVEQGITVQTFQPREAGMRARADRFPDYRGISYATVREGDHFVFDPGARQVEHRFNPADEKRKTKPIAGAWAQIRRAGRDCAPVWIPIGERVGKKKDGTLTAMWGTKTETMMSKCARAEAYRIEYPGAFAGTYIREEFEDEEEIEVNARPEGSKVDQVAAKVEAAKTAKSSAPTPASQQTVEVRVEKTISPPPAKPVETPKVEEPKFLGPAFGFGPAKGKSVQHAEDATVLETIRIGEEKVAAEPKAAWAAPVSEEIGRLRLELERRFKLKTTREPGSDDGDESPAVDPKTPPF